MNYWLIVGVVKNWVTAFEYGNIWGLKKTQRNLWESLTEGDTVLFYATQPVSGIIGHGRVRTKFCQDKPLWPGEVRKGEIIWPLRFEFDVESCLPKEQWKAKKLVSKKIWPRAGFQLISKDVAVELISAIGTTEYVIPTAEKELSIAEEVPPGSRARHLRGVAPFVEPDDQRYSPTRSRYRDDRRQGAGKAGRPALRERGCPLRGPRSLADLAADPSPATEHGLSIKEVRASESSTGGRGRRDVHRAGGGADHHGSVRHG